MSIRYPLAMPETLSIREVRWRGESAVALGENPFSLVPRTQDWLGRRWGFHVSLPPIAQNPAKAEKWFSWLLAMNGHVGRFNMGHPLRRVPLGTALGLPVARGSHAAGLKTLQTHGWMASQEGVLEPGDFIQVTKNYLLDPNNLSTGNWQQQQSTRAANTSDVTDPLGTNTATKVTPTGSDCALWQQYTGLPYVPGYSFGAHLWIRAASGAPSIDVRLVGNAANSVAIGSTTAVISSSAWTFFDIPPAVAPTTADRVGLRIGGASSWPTGDGALYIWGACVYAAEYDARLHKVLQQASGDASGLSTLELWPPLRVALTGGERIVTSSPTGLFMLDSPVAELDADYTRVYGLEFGGIEAKD